MAEPTKGAAPAPKAPTPPAGANAKPGDNGHAPPAPSGQPSPPPFDPAAAGLVYRAGADGKPGKWVRPVKANGQEFDFDPTDPEAWHGVSTHRAAQRHITEAQKTKKAWDDVLAAFKADPVNTMREVGKKLMATAGS